MRHLTSTLVLLLLLLPACTPAPPVTPAAPEPIVAVPLLPILVSAPSPKVKVPWSQADLPRILAVQPLVHVAAAEYGVDANVVNAIIWHESRFHAAARGPGGAAGLMQLMPTTSKGLAKRLHRANRPYDPDFNVAAGSLLLSRLLRIFSGDLTLALAGYGLGHVAVQRRIAAGEPLPERTGRFAARVQSWVPAFATLPCPTGFVREGVGACVRS